MGRPREFDTDIVVEAALAVFWEQGLHRTSVDDLLEAISLSKSSLYNSFGSKEALFEQVAALYVEQQVACLTKTLAAAKLETALKKLFYSAINDNYEGRGCLLVNSTGALNSESAVEKALLREGFQSLFAVVAERMHQAQQNKEISRATDPATAATLVCSHLCGLGVFQKAGIPKARLKRTADLAVESIITVLQA